MEGNKLTVPAANAPLRETKEAQEKREKAAKRRKTGKREGWLSTAPQGSQPASQCVHSRRRKAEEEPQKCQHPLCLPAQAGGQH